MQYINCKQYSQEILDAVKAIPNKKSLVILTVGDNPASKSYVKGKIKDCEYCGIPYNHICIDDNPSAGNELMYQIHAANVDDSVGGIIVQLPLPEWMDADFYTDQVRMDKDVDGFKPSSPFKPCTPEGIMYLLRKELGDLTGRDALVIGRGKLVGEPLAKMLLEANCTVTVAHSKSKFLNGYVALNHIIVSAAGKPNLVNMDYAFSADIIIDAGINRDANGKLCGDCYTATEDVPDEVKVTPVPGGVGLMTRAMLMAHVARLDVNTVLY